MKSPLSLSIINRMIMLMEMVSSVDDEEVKYYNITK